jgi:hypothetical protein
MCASRNLDSLAVDQMRSCDLTHLVELSKIEGKGANRNISTRQPDTDRRYPADTPER